MSIVNFLKADIYDRSKDSPRNVLEDYLCYSAIEQFTETYDCKLNELNHK